MGYSFYFSRTFIQAILLEDISIAFLVSHYIDPPERQHVPYLRGPWHVHEQGIREECYPAPSLKIFRHIHG
jgi:hypothetical protein